MLRALGVVVVDHEHVCAPAGRRALTSAAAPSASVSRIGVARQEAGRAGASRSWRRSSAAEREHRQVARARIALEPAERLGLLGVAEAEHDHVGPVLLGERERGRRAHGHQALEARRAGDVERGRWRGRRRCRRSARRGRPGRPARGRRATAGVAARRSAGAGSSDASSAGSAARSSASSSAAAAAGPPAAAA